VSAEEFYRDNVLTIICPFGVGGGNDYAARMFAAYWPEVSGAAAKVVNEAGGGTIVGTNAVYSAKPDGLTIGNSMLGKYLLPITLFKEPGRNHDIGKFNYLGLFCDEPFGIGISATLPILSVEDLKKTVGFTVGVQSPTGVDGLAAALLFDTLQLKDAKIISGYAGSAEVALAVAKGEVSATIQTCATLIDHVKKGYTHDPLVVFDFERTEVLPDTLAIAEVADLTPQQEEFLTILSVLRGNRLFFAPPGVPEDRLQFLRNAWAEMFTMEPFAKDMKRRFPIWTTPKSGEVVAAEVAKGLAVSEESIAGFKQLVEKYLPF